MTRPKCQNMLRWSGQNANQKVGTDKMPTTEKRPDKMPTFGWHYVRLAFCPHTDMNLVLCTLIKLNYRKSSFLYALSRANSSALCHCFYSAPSVEYLFCFLYVLIVWLSQLPLSASLSLLTVHFLKFNQKSINQADHIL